MKVFSREQWDAMPESKKGYIGSVFDRNGREGRWKGLHTLQGRGRRLVEGIDFAVVNLPRAKVDEFSLI